MKNKIPCFILVICLSTLLWSCKDKIIVSFSYEPIEPKIGESVKFTNLSDGGETFDWTFTNESTGSYMRSMLENPTRIFTAPGDYAVTLRVDSNDNFVSTKRFYVYDSIPNIKRDKETVVYYGNVAFSAIAYNPYGRTKTYQWFFSENARNENGEMFADTTIVTEDGSEAKLYVSYEAEPVVYFNKLGEETVRLQMSIGDSVYTVKQIKHQAFTIEDAATRSLLMAQKGGKILRQRIFENGTDEVKISSIEAGSHPFNIVSSGEQLFIFDAGSDITEKTNWEIDTNGDGSIRAVNLNNDSEAAVITNEGVSSYFGFYNGYVDDEYIYWTDRNDFVYRTTKDARNLTFEWKGNRQNEVSYYLTGVESLGYSGNGMAAGQYNGGIYAYNGTYYWAKGGEGKGLFRFRQEDIGKTELPKSGAILQDYAIRAFAYDRVNGQIYYSVTAPADKIGMWVADLDGKHERQIEKAAQTGGAQLYITGISIDYAAGKVLWAYNNPANEAESGIKQIKIIRSSAEKPGEVTYFNHEKNIMGITLDNVLKLK